MKTRGLLLLLMATLCCLILTVSCALLDRIPGIGGEDCFEVSLELAPGVTAAFNVPGHWPVDLGELPCHLYPLGWPVAVWHAEDAGGVKYEIIFSINDGRVYVLLEYRTCPSPDDRKFYLFVDGVPIGAGVAGAIEFIRGLFASGGESPVGDDTRLRATGELCLYSLKGKEVGQYAT